MSLAHTRRLRHWRTYRQTTSRTASPSMGPQVTVDGLAAAVAELNRLVQLPALRAERERLLRVGVAMIVS